MDVLLRDLGATQEYLVTQRSVTDTTAAQTQQLQTWIGRLSSMSIQAADASRIVALIGEGPWNQEQRTELANAVNTAVINSSVVPPAGSRRPLQACANFKAYLSQNDLNVLGQQDTPMVSKIDTLCTRMVRIGLHCPQETCMKLVMAVGQACGLQVPEGSDNKLAVVKELKRVLDVNAVGNIPLRLSNRLVKPGVNHSNQLVPCPGGGPSTPPGGTGMQAGAMNSWFQMMMTMQQQMQYMQQQQMGQTGELPNLQIFRPQATPQRRALTNGDTKTENPPQNTPQQNTNVENNQGGPQTLDKSSTVDKSKPETTLAPAQPSQSAPLSLPVPEALSPEAQAAAVQAATQQRKDAKPKTQPKAKAKGKAKAKAKVSISG
eukprot:s2257_g13.t1